MELEINSPQPLQGRWGQINSSPKNCSHSHRLARMVHSFLVALFLQQLKD